MYFLDDKGNKVEFTKTDTERSYSVEDIKRELCHLRYNAK